MKRLIFPLTINDGVYFNKYMYTAHFQKGIKNFKQTNFRNPYPTPLNEVRAQLSKTIGQITLLTGVNILDLLKSTPPIIYTSDELPNDVIDFLKKFEDFLNFKLNYKVIKVDKSIIKTSYNGPFCDTNFKKLSNLIGPNFYIDNDLIASQAGYRRGSSCISSARASHIDLVGARKIGLGVFVIDDGFLNNNTIDLNARCFNLNFNFFIDKIKDPNGDNEFIDIGTYNIDISSNYRNEDNIKTINYLLENIDPIIPQDDSTLTIKAKVNNFSEQLKKIPIPYKVQNVKTGKVEETGELTSANDYTATYTKPYEPINETYDVIIQKYKLPANLVPLIKIYPVATTKDRWQWEFTIEYTSDDPYTGPGGGGGGTGPGGGGVGPSDPSSHGEIPGGPGQIDTINPVEPPSISINDTGLLSIFTPTKSQIQELARSLWDPSFSEKFSRMFSDPMDAIIGLTTLPINVGTAGQRQIIVGNVGTKVHSNIALSQYIFKTLGSIAITPKYNSYLDYSPFTSIQIYLPFIGYRPLNTDEVMNTSITITYAIDIIDGSLVATIRNSNGLLIAQHAGNCATSIPLSGRDFAGTIQAGLTIAGAVGLTIASGGVGAGAGAGLVAGAGAGATTATAIGAGSAIASSVMNSKPKVQRSGSVGGSCSFLSTRTPYVIIERPNACVPGAQNEQEGYPSYITRELGQLTGFTTVSAINLSYMPTATDNERNEITQLLKGGVYL